MKKNKIIISGRSGDNYQNNKLFSKKYAYFNQGKKKIFREDNNIGLNYLKKKIIQAGYKLITTDTLSKKDTCAVEMHFFGSFIKKKARLYYCILPEIREIAKNCEINILKNKYDKIFTNIEEDIDNKKVFHINQPQSNNYKKNIIRKKKFSCLIANNKNLNSYSSYSGYSERIKLINWFQEYHPNELDIYGSNWDKYYFHNYYLNRILLYLQNKLHLKKKLSDAFKGSIQCKIPVLSNYKFSFCFENYFGSKGYFTEKIFDSFYAGTIPIYLGCSNVEKYLPSNIFINYKKFNDLNEIYKYMNSIDKKMYIKFQMNIIDFLSSKNFSKFHYKKFAKIIVSHIKQDINLNSVHKVHCDFK